MTPGHKLIDAVEHSGIDGIVRQVQFRDGRHTGAVFSLCGDYRYVLWWIWNFHLPLWFYGLLNPSTATELKLDPTLHRCRVRAEMRGAGGMVIGNAGGIRETKSQLAIRHLDPIGPHNRAWLELVVCLCDMHIVGHGPLAAKFGGDKLLQDIFLAVGVQLHRLELTDAGVPKHPLYTAYEIDPVPYTMPLP